MDKNSVYGSAQVAGGCSLSYLGLNHGLPRALGIRIEYHTTTKENAKLIQNEGNILNPNCGGNNGWSQKVNSTHYINNSKNYVHITGFNAKSDMKEFPQFIQKYFKAPFKTIFRKLNCMFYQTVGNLSLEELKEMQKKSKIEAIKTIIKAKVSNLLKDKTKIFCIPGIDSYFSSEFIPDPDSAGALKTNKKLKVYNNRFAAMVGGLRKFGLKGIIDNKSRATAGFGIVSLCLYGGYKLIKKGYKKLSNEDGIALNTELMKKEFTH